MFVLFSCCFHEGNEDQVHVECSVDPTQESSFLYKSQAGYEIHQ